MADVIGPSSYLPGQTLASPPSMCCDEHPGRAAVKRVVGETDSFGSELIDWCQECYDAYKNRDRTEEQTGCCDWCHCHATDLRPHRDFEEGQGGPVYQVCGACVKKENDACAEELGEREYYDLQDMLAELDLEA